MALWAILPAVAGWHRQGVADLAVFEVDCWPRLVSGYLAVVYLDVLEGSPNPVALLLLEPDDLSRTEARWASRPKLLEGTDHRPD